MSPECALDSHERLFGRDVPTGVFAGRPLTETALSDAIDSVDKAIVANGWGEPS